MEDIFGFVPSTLKPLYILNISRVVLSWESGASKTSTPVVLGIVPRTPSASSEGSWPTQARTSQEVVEFMNLFEPNSTRQRFSSSTLLVNYVGFMMRMTNYSDLKLGHFRSYLPYSCLRFHLRCFVHPTRFPHLAGQPDGRHLLLRGPGLRGDCSHAASPARRTRTAPFRAAWISAVGHGRSEKTPW